jgi:DNA-binding transcriptional regulator YhcF (GntR family)
MILPIQHVGFGMPKYKQLIASVEDAILSKKLFVGDALPSINELGQSFGFSRDTVLTALNELKARGIVQAIARKGCYVSGTDISIKQKVFVLFDEFNAFKEDLYNAFLEALPPHFQVDIFFHHFNRNIFSKLILDHVGQYNYYVVMPANVPKTEEVLSHLSPHQVYVLDQTTKGLSKYPSVYQNFDKGIFDSLMAVKDLLDRYTNLILIYPEKKQPKAMVSGFQRFKRLNKLNYELIKTLKGRQPKRREVYLVLEDSDLILLIKSIKSEGLTVGRDVGVISYNDSMFKEILEGGITTISTDFKQMGSKLASMILNRENIKVENPNQIIIRQSL